MKKKTSKQPKRTHTSIFVIPKDLNARLRNESHKSGRSRSDIVREALYMYFAAAL